MNIDELTIADVKVLNSLLGSASAKSECHHWQIGKAYFIRTVTHHLTGRLIAVTDHELVIEDAAWIPNDGRFNESLRDGTFSECEPAPPGPVLVGRGSLIDAYLWLHDLPNEVK